MVHAALLHTGRVLFITADETTLLWNPEDATPTAFEDPVNQPHLIPDAGRVRELGEEDDLPYLPGPLLEREQTVARKSPVPVEWDVLPHASWAVERQKLHAWPAVKHNAVPGSGANVANTPTLKGFLN